MNRLSFKIGLLFFVFILIIESFLFFILYTNLANERIEEVMNSLLARGNTHRDVLEDYYDSSTLEHVGIMESASEFIVVITDEQGEVIISSDPVDKEIMKVITYADTGSIPTEGQVIADRWTEEEYIATDSPITIDQDHRGHVFMFVHTDYVKKIVDQLSRQFIITGIITILLTILTIFILSRFIAHPLIKMKEATEQLSKGKHDVILHTGRKDELGELANSITQLAKELKELKAARNEFLASISHELRTPLTYIKGYADIINRGNITDEELKQYVAILRDETEQLNNLIKGLFQLAQIDQHNFVINREQIDLCELIQLTTEWLRPALMKKELTLQVYCENRTIAHIDPERMKQVLINVLDNAQKHAYQGTEIIIDVQTTVDEVTVEITDEGEGIPEKDLPFILDRLYRVEKSRSRKSGGSGLGLAITKEIIESHGGTIDIQSTLGEGTSIIMTLKRLPI